MKIQLPPPSRYGDTDLLDSHTWSLASADGSDITTWIELDAAQENIELDLSENNWQDKISRLSPH